jgi:hypothetical protein
VYTLSLHDALPISSTSMTASRLQKWCFVSAELPVVIFAIKHCVSIPPNTFIAMHPLEVYYLNQRVVVVPISGDRPYLCSPALPTACARNRKFFGRFFRWVRHLLWRGAKAVGRETLRTGDKILIDIAENKSLELSPKDIVTKGVTESVQNLIGNLRVGGRKRARGVTSVTKKR